MPLEVSKPDARMLRMRAQGLTASSSWEIIDEAVHGCVGIQAQDRSHAPLAIRARCPGSTHDGVHSTQVNDRTIVRTWCFRGSLHYIATSDAPWIVPLCGPVYVRRGQRRLTALGLNQEDCALALEILRTALDDQNVLTRDVVGEILLDAGFEFDPDGQAPYHIVRRLCLEGIACEGAPSGGSETYRLIDEWIPDASFEDDNNRGLTNLAGRYLASHEPATFEDFHAWSGLYKRDTKAGWESIEPDTEEVIIAGRTARIWSNPDRTLYESPKAPKVRLLPMYDGFVLGYHDRDLHLPTDYVDRVRPGGGVIRPTVVVDGLISGTWTFDRSGSVPTITVDPFEPFGNSIESAIENDVDDIGRFFDQEVTLAFDGN